MRTCSGSGEGLRQSDGLGAASMRTLVAGGGTARAATLLATLAQGTSLGIWARSTAHLDYRGTSLIAGSSSQDFTGTVGHGTWSGSAVRAEEVAAAYRRAIDLASATTAFGPPWVVSVVLKPYNHMRHMGLWLQSSATPRPKDARIDPHARAVRPRSSYRTARPPSRFAPPLLPSGRSIRRGRSASPGSP